MVKELLLLLVAIGCETSATCLLKTTDGLTRLWPWVGVGAGYLCAFGLMATVLQRLPVGMVYATWSGLGTVVTVTFGIVFFRDRLPAASWLGLSLVIVGVVLLGLTAPHHE
jgi:multidrug transporter EmrE-like cation transporter